MYFKVQFGEEKFIVPIKVTKQMTIEKLLEAIKSRLSLEMGKSVDIPQIVTAENYQFFSNDLVEEVLTDGAPLLALTNEQYYLKYIK